MTRDLQDIERAVLDALRRRGEHQVADRVEEILADRRNDTDLVTLSDLEGFCAAARESGADGESSVHFAGTRNDFYQGPPPAIRRRHPRKPVETLEDVLEGL